jgi:predicted CXXCH cytochrome family protein
MSGFIICLISPLSQAARVVAEKRECAICHIAWMADFKKDDIQTLVPYDPRPQVETGRQDVVSTERMCFSCHDGFVLDSRFLWLKDKHTHPVGVVPSDRVSIPKEEGKTIFPLNDEGKVYCGTCHSAHGVEWGDKLSPVFLRTRNIDSSLCMSCHVDRVEIINGEINHPLNKEVPMQAEKLLDSGSKFSRKSEVICQSCHMVHAAQDNKLLVVENEKSQLCEACHVEKTGLPGKSGKIPYTHPVDVVPKDVTIPKAFTEAGSKLGPNNEVICQTCHKTHLTPSEKLLVLDAKYLKQGICVVCHENKRSIQATGHNLLENNRELLSKNERSPSQNLGICGVCHQVHNGKGPKMWASEIKSEGDQVASLCLSCHSEGEAAQKHLVGKYSHPVGVPLQNKVQLGDLPLFTDSGQKTKSKRYGLVSCPTCHDVHGPASKQNQNSLSGDLSGGSGKYLRKGENDLLELCKTCHKDKWAITNTKHDIKQYKNNSTPLGICGNCHQVHNGNGLRMWARSGNLDEKDLGTLCMNCNTKGG